MKSWIRNGIAGAVLAGSLMVAQSAVAALYMVAKIGDIKGESGATKHQGEIDILSYSWGVAQPNAKVGEQSAGKVGTVNALTLTKYVDAASPALFLGAAEGKMMPYAQFVVLKSAGKEPIEMIRIKLENVVVASVTTGQPTANDRLTETITLVFSAAEYTYTGQKADGSKGDSVRIVWHNPRK
jgi:type VI secretion system secreted protein Hcp